MKTDRDQRCHGAHTWARMASWLDTGASRWIEEGCQKCGLLRRKRDG